jgi:hypothetical protein
MNECQEREKRREGFVLHLLSEPAMAAHTPKQTLLHGHVVMCILDYGTPFTLQGDLCQTNLMLGTPSPPPPTSLSLSLSL